MSAPRYIIETATASDRRTLGDALSLIEAQAQCALAMSQSRARGGPDFAFAIDEHGRYCVALERTADGRILDHLAGRAEAK